MSSAARRRELAEMTANAVAAVRARVSSAAGAAEEVDRLLRRAEESLGELPGQAERIRSAAEFSGPPFSNWQAYQDGVEQRFHESRSHFGNAQYYADDIGRRLDGAQDLVRQVRGQLDEARMPLRYAREFLDELENLPADEAEQQGSQIAGAGVPELTTATMRERLDRLGAAIESASQGVDATDRRIRDARRNVEALRGVSVGFEGPERGAALVDQVGRAVKADVDALNGGLKEAYAADDAAGQATAKANELAIAVHAGLNPTPRSAQTIQRPPVEDPRRAWSEGRDLGPTVGR